MQACKSHFVQMCVCVYVCVCVWVSASRVFANWQWFTDKSRQRCAVTERLTACQCRMIQISLHYECKDEFKNTQDCELFSLSPHTLRGFFTWCCSDTPGNVWINEETVGDTRFLQVEGWCEVAFMLRSSATKTFSAKTEEGTQLVYQKQWNNYARKIYHPWSV